MIVQVDVDGVLADFRRGWATLAAEKYNVILPLQESSWDQLYGPPLEEGWSDQMWEHIRQSRTFWGSLWSLLSEYETLKLRQLMLDHTFYFVTSRVGKTAKQQTEVWLDHVLGLHYLPTVIISKRKADAANALDADYVIDDKPGNVLATYYLSPPNRKIYIRDHPFNQFDHEVAGKRIRRVTSFASFLFDIEMRR